MLKLFKASSTDNPCRITEIEFTHDDYIKLFSS